MHEVGIAHNIVDIAEDYARREGAESIRTVALRIGAMAGVVPEALEFAFETAKAGTLAATATLDVEYVPLLCFCADCQLEFEIKDRFGIALCPHCSEPSADIRQGFELELRYLEVV